MNFFPAPEHQELVIVYPVCINWGTTQLLESFYLLHAYSSQLQPLQGMSFAQEINMEQVLGQWCFSPVVVLCHDQNTCIMEITKLFLCLYDIPSGLLTD